MITERPVNEVSTLDGPEGHKTHMTMVSGIERAKITRFRDMSVAMPLPGFVMNDFMHRSAAISYPFTRIAKPFFLVDPMVLESLVYDDATDRHVIDGTEVTCYQEDMNASKHAVSLHGCMPVTICAEAMPSRSPPSSPPPGPPTLEQEAMFWALLTIHVGIRHHPRRRRHSG